MFTGYPPQVAMSESVAAVARWCCGFELFGSCSAFLRTPANAAASAIKSFVSIRTGENVDVLDAFFMSAGTPLNELLSRVNKCKAGANRRTLILNQLSKSTRRLPDRLSGPGDNLSGYARPAFFHNASTLRRTSGVMVITSGHGRWKPSSFHLRVASMPIFDP